MTAARCTRWARLRQERQAQGLSQATLAGPEFTKSYVNEIERGCARPSLKARELLAGRLHLPVDELLRLEAPHPSAANIPALAEDIGYQLDHVKLLLHRQQGEDALRLLPEMAAAH